MIITNRKMHRNKHMKNPIIISRVHQHGKWKFSFAGVV